METNSELQRVCRQCCDGAAGSPMNISTRWSMALWCCFRRLFASLSTWLACQRRAQRPRLTTSRLPPRPSCRNNGIGPEGATSLAGPLATLTKLQWLELRYCPLAACGVALGGREAGRRGNADGLGAREGGNTLRFAKSLPALCCTQTASFPTPGAGKIFPSFLTFLTFLTFFSLSRTLVTLPRAPFRPPRRFIILRYVHPPPPLRCGPKRDVTRYVT